MAWGFCVVLCQKGYFIIPGVFSPTPSSKNNIFFVRMPPEKIAIAPSRRMPAWILDKGGVDPQIHTHRFAAAGTAGNQPRGDPKIGLRPNHFMHKRLIVIGFLVTRHAALPQSIIALHVEQAVMIESRPLELMIDIGRDHKIILPLHEFQQPFIHRIAGRAVPVQLNIPAPIGPVFLQRIKWVKSAGIHILKSIRIREILKCS